MLTLILSIVVGALLYYKIIKPARYWAERGIRHEPSWPIVGNMFGLLTRKKHFVELSTGLYKKYPNDRYVGYLQFASPCLMLRDLDLIKQIYVTDFDNFHDHIDITNAEMDPLFSKSLLNLRGDKWKQMRATLSPAFTSSKMKNMYPLLAKCAQNFTQHFHSKGEVAVDMKDVISRFSNDVIATTAFGIQVDSLKEPENEFFVAARSLALMTPIKMAKMFLSQKSKKLQSLLHFRMLDEHLANFFTSVISSNLRKREKEGIIRPDLIHLLMEARKGRLRHDTTSPDPREGFATVEESHIGKTTQQMELTDMDIAAQALLFFFAGFQTISSAVSLMAYELAVNPDIQRKLQQEIDEVRRQYIGEVPYETLSSMKYLDQVISETLRMWPPGFQTDRFCNKNYTIPPKSPEERTIVVETGVLVVVPIMALQHDPQYFPEPERFDPERFNDENKGKILPGTYLPFGIGPRNCIGSRFALLEMKTLFFHLLSKFDIEPNEKTEIPIRISPKSLGLDPENGFHFTLKPRI